MDGILNILKPKGFTSHDVVAKCRGILKIKKIGHTGTLDPDAWGVLPICIGKATKVVSYLTDVDKCYQAEVILGVNTTTEDITGEIVETFPVNVTKEQIQNVVDSFIGEYTQVPPMYSAIKINGVRLYELARKGITIERPARTVYIYNCEIIEWISENRFKINVHCSKGTYIRTLCTDIGKKLGCGAHMGDLVRTKVGRFILADSITLEELQDLVINLNKKGAEINQLYKIEELFEDYPILTVKQTASKRLYNGNFLSLEDINEELPLDKKLRIYDANDKFIGLYNIQDDIIKPEKMFL
ncbi:tRNA pseudouridine(55) synthase TruB [Candidatus Epulonipiscium fishelsonii]|uniref:tRNA pseudouridine(55) synthase TruB n=1 Tax=Candidatus Epulonipiscium fishelsonii TaxID=77094 RepID=A0ACC8XFS8_9FIRM|nr:tRNA pseudouridine(55) synthase TruB [Epulopiscium sp. SCG-B11WGA-EpuloA1]ONI42866.1 tRNA pseudouridine(55) synthase TruB [Epulopiscium sp. SCG-B05WGA-EpuloA1]